VIPTTTVTIVGNLTRDPELRFTPAGTPVATFGIAVNTRRRNEAGEWVDNDPQFYNVTAWRDLAENLAASVEKGARAVVVGRLTYRTWEAKDGSGQRSAVEVVADACGPELTWATASVEKVTRAPADRAPHPAFDPSEEPF
jgi:single-strand DNA-binding protein